MEHIGYSHWFTNVRSRAATSVRKDAGCARLNSSWLRVLFPLALLSLLGISIILRHNLEQRDVADVVSRHNLVLLPEGEVLKPMVLGNAQLAADLVWLELVQVLGADDVSDQDYQWIRHALDVITTLDPKFIEAYDLGGVVLAELGKHVEWSNALLEKGMAANPQAWRLPFLLGFNHFFYLQDYGRAAGFLAKAARLPGSPAYVPELAARLYVQADTPETALMFIETIQRESKDAAVATALERRRKEVLIERDIVRLEQSLEKHMVEYGSLPSSLEQLVERGLLSSLPTEPFGGAYQLDVRTGGVASTTHPQRLRMYDHGHGHLASWSSLP
jgi:hypothetical protein